MGNVDDTSPFSHSEFVIPSASSYRFLTSGLPHFDTVEVVAGQRTHIADFFGVLNTGGVEGIPGRAQIQAVPELTIVELDLRLMRQIQTGVNIDGLTDFDVQTVKFFRAERPAVVAVGVFRRSRTSPARQRRATARWC
jgi:hypothetical protein